MGKINRDMVFEKTNGHCGYCGCDIDRKKFHVEHIVPQYNFVPFVANKKVPDFLAHLTKDDVNHFDNLLAACASCNNYKHSMDLEGCKQ